MSVCDKIKDDVVLVSEPSTVTKHDSTDCWGRYIFIFCVDDFVSDTTMFCLFLEPV